VPLFEAIPLAEQADRVRALACEILSTFD